MIIYYKRIITYHKYPDNDQKDQDYILFSTSLKKFDKNVIEGVKFNPNTSIEEKENFLKQHLKIKKVTVKKI
ncbi:hypothetical protein C1637_09750 [Chryseobacterium lactis]|uniref:Uncharacterized protein n=1 Tax=Chryseobacterium lactis TaxID=1241981 RepID=A0A3G6RHU8_CHRLC|nr:hypothetical protein EG342_09950 [Chryseobacterium lactis]AZB02587.1 hypothetical protein EG341_00805 [Chryseobacterium lactis]PNW14118.1 hypothetical protein C1637_09750 [Chryseobacterium lactis]